MSNIDLTFGGPSLCVQREALHSPTPDLNVLLKSVAEELLPLLGQEIRLRMFRASGTFPIAVPPNQIENLLGRFFVQAKEEMQTGGMVFVQTAQAASHVVVTLKYFASDMDCSSGRETSINIHLPVIEV